MKEKSVDVPKISLHTVIWNFLLSLDFLLLIVNKRVHSEVLGCNLKNNKMISVHFQGKPFNVTVIQVYAPTSNAEEAEIEPFYEDLIELRLKKESSSLEGIGMQR